MRSCTLCAKPGIARSEQGWTAQHSDAVHSCTESRRWTLAQTSFGLLASCAVCQPANADDLRKTYDNAAPSYDALDGGAAADLLGFPKLRRKLLSRAAGNVLEVAVGTGINLPYYDASRVSRFTGIDLSPGMLAEARAKLESLDVRRKAQLLTGDVGDLPFADNSFDVVVSTFSLCVFEDPVRALAEMRRVTASGGRLLLLEHSRSSWPLLGAYQDLTARAVAATSRGCVWNQDLRRLASAAGLRLVNSEAALGGLITAVEAVSEG